MSPVEVLLMLRLLLFAMLLLPGIAVAQTTISVCSTCDHTTILAAYTAAAASGDTIRVDDGTWTVDELDIEKDLTIESLHGSAHSTLDAGSGKRLFKVQAGSTVTLTGFTLVHGSDRAIEIKGSSTFTGTDLVLGTASAADDGLGIKVHETSTATLEQVVFSDHTASAKKGAGVYCKDSTLTIRDATFTTMDATSGGAVYAEVCTLTLEDTEITAGSAYQGGGIYGKNSDITVSDSGFANCAASGTPDPYGAAIYAWVDEVGHTFAVTGTTFKGNTAAAYGGAIYLEGAAAKLYDVTLEDNTFRNNSGTWGGALSASYIELDAVRNRWCGNSSTIAGGAVSGWWLGASTWANDAFWDNSTTGDGGAVELVEAPVSFTNCAFLDNEAAGDGGGLYLVDSDFEFINGVVAWTVAGDGLYADWAKSGSFAITYSDWWSNTAADVSGDLVAGDLALTTPGSGNFAADPELYDYNADSNCRNDVLYPMWGSPLIDHGDPALYDPDDAGDPDPKNRSDVGPYGGPDADPSFFVDGDSDGYAAVYDCADDDEFVYPGADEVCDEVDNDCDGTVDVGAIDADTWYADTDEDGYGDPELAVISCTEPAGYVDDNTDCDDEEFTVYPGADEICDDMDNDCDDDIDGDAIDRDTWYLDGDNDGFGLDTSTTLSCDEPSGHADVGGDCDDEDDFAYPGADEYCDGHDDDCDDEVDEDDAVDVDTWYLDDDDDSYGDDEVTVVQCYAPADHVDRGGDCRDFDSAAYPGADEYCDGHDDDCDEEVDEDDAVDADTWYLDGDGDGFGTDAGTIVACDAPSGYAQFPTDCDDEDEDAYPGADEYCDGHDDDCDDLVDEDDAVDASTWYADGDKDSYGDPDSTAVACDAPDGFVGNDADCDDEVTEINPVADELCDDVDNDCDEEVDEDDAVDAPTWYEDGDGDGYGVDGATDVACDQPDGFAATDDDCDDTEELTYPGAPEQCDGEDNDCDDAIDEDTEKLTWYLDDDGDGLGDSSVTLVDCARPDGYVANADDCDDSDETVLGPTTWYLDDDDDGYGELASTTDACEQPSGYTDDATDCDDDASTTYPGADEYCDEVDNDCDDEVDEDDAVDASLWYFDLDGDGFGVPGDFVAACEAPYHYVDNGLDCNDLDPTTNPDAVEQCDDVDHDCDGSPDNDVEDRTWYADADADGYGDPETSQVDCVRPEGYVLDGTDCDDTAYGVNPGVVEVWYDGVDSDCDGASDYDQDGDGYDRDLDGGDDCDDLDKDIHPMAEEVWYDGVDSDCDGASDYDQDGDGYDSDLYAGTDCDDEDPDIHPGATDIPDDDVDQDCDGVDPTAADPTRTWTADTDQPGLPPAGCGCASGPAPIGWLLGLVPAVALRRRRERR